MAQSMKKAKLTILGLGLVGRSLINLLLNDKVFSMDDIRVVDMNEEVYSYFSNLGGKRENFINMCLDSKNYRKIFTGMQTGDYLIRLVDECDDMAFAKECMERGIHYI